MSFNPQPKVIRPKKTKAIVKVVRNGKSAKPKTKHKKQSMPKHIRDLALKEFQKQRKLEESRNGWCICISCGKLIHTGTTDCQGGHYITRQNRATELEPDNIHPQCARCNVLLHGNLVAYRFNLVKKIGLKRVERLENMALAREGNEEALARLSEEDKQKALMKKTQKYYQGVYTRARQIVIELEGLC